MASMPYLLRFGGQVYRDACLVGSDSQEVSLAGVDGITTMVRCPDLRVRCDVATADERAIMMNDVTCDTKTRGTIVLVARGMMTW